ncbi:dioxygenase [Anaerocolumna cellulosilytica]|uniref:Dioxygenase n=1 Tax=Anaerocolumna cellulosilytica TaxID=433286 RepID=A0A6S6R3M9_9FIRM|nr:4,5-DOPA dioxygenase extradiol [Anaerocolumna cellulosilytica]MBB5194140.1 4,5-DOPA dioxygenase extradiol [Anaerocolumna cellulosilytica]BCJ94647.1 dioxygenase [Anaerocolumna cellulosilytica]
MERMPALFIGHGSPMNAIEENTFVKEWKALKDKLPHPEAILSVSAHWFTSGTKVSDSRAPETIYDMYGFPKELYEIIYKAKGAPQFAHKTQQIISRQVAIDNTWGYDHGTWSVLHRIYPEADIPVFQLSVDRNASVLEHYKIGQELTKLREQGVLIFGSGNVVHNLARISWEMEGGYTWAEEFDAYIKENIVSRKDDNVLNYHKIGTSSTLAFTSLDHYAPLLYVLGASHKSEQITVFNDSCILGSLSMTSYLFE